VHGGSVGKTVRVIADLAEHVATMDRPNSREADDRGLGVVVEHGGEFGFERGDEIAHRGDDRDQPEGGNAKGVLDWRGLTQHLGASTAWRMARLHPALPRTSGSAAGSATMRSQLLSA
jgi:hypothetical protein